MLSYIIKKQVRSFNKKYRKIDVDVDDLEKCLKHIEGLYEFVEKEVESNL
ncbi:MAG: hypothetical protein ACOC2U_02830 [bacterium]